MKEQPIRVYGFKPDKQPPTAKNSNQVTRAVVCSENPLDLTAFAKQIEKEDGAISRNKIEDVIAPAAIEVYYDNTYRYRGAIDTLKIFGIIGGD